MTFANQNPNVSVIPHQGGKTKWVLSEDYYYHWQHKGIWYRLKIDAGFVFDGASVPWFLRWIAGRGRFGVLAPLVHDVIHFKLGLARVEVFTGGGWNLDIFTTGFTRRNADRLFFRILREQNVQPRWLRRGAFKLVRLWSVIKGDKWG